MKNYDDIGDYPQAIRDAFANFCDHSKECSAEECSDAYLNALNRLNIAIAKWLKAPTYLEFQRRPGAGIPFAGNEKRSPARARAGVGAIQDNQTRNQETK